ncbi:MAG: DUF1049 domain-containing protein [Erythrobacter sp.]
MQIVRTLVWLVILLGVLAFSFANWDERATVHIWQNLVWDTRLPAVVIVSFLLGMLPVWMLHRGTKWRLSRRISTLENAARSSALSRHNPAPAANTSDTAIKDDTLKPTSGASS